MLAPLLATLRRSIELTMILQPDQLTGQVDSHLRRDAAGTGLQPDCWAALHQLQAAAAEAGFELQVASGFRSFDRQLAIWNRKATAERPVYDDTGQALLWGGMADLDWMHAILRFSALPGSSRHHWGTDLDVFDAAVMPEGYQLQLSPTEVADDGRFGALHRWLDARIAAGESFGFQRPYAIDCGGVACERWHLSYSPLAQQCETQLSEVLLRGVIEGAQLEMRELVLEQLEDIYLRYVLTGAI